jgi:Tfp pilus assembly protein PilO
MAQVECERREPKRGFSAWVRRNLGIPAIVAILMMLAALIGAGYGLKSNADKGAAAATRVDAIEKDYVSRNDLERRLEPMRQDIKDVGDRMDKLMTVIIERLP